MVSAHVLDSEVSVLLQFGISQFGPGELKHRIRDSGELEGLMPTQEEELPLLLPQLEQ